MSVPPGILFPSYLGEAFAAGDGKLTGGILYDHMVAEAFRGRGWRVATFDLETLPRYAKMLRVPVRGLLSAACRGDRDVLLTDLGNSSLTLGLQRAEAARGRLTVLLCHHFRAGIERTLPKRLLYRITERGIVAGAGLLVANSPHTASVLVSMGRDPADIIQAPPGLSVPRAQAPRFRDAPTDLLMVGGIEPRKGAIDAVRALAVSGLDRAVLTIAGDPGGPSAYRRELDEVIGRSGLEARVRFVGRLDAGALTDAYRRADAFVLLSGWEGYGMAIAEAMASGLPVLSTTAGAIPQLVRHGVSGLLSEPGDWKAAAANMRDLFTDGALRAALARGALEGAAGLPTWERSMGGIVDAVEARLGIIPCGRRSSPGT